MSIRRARPGSKAESRPGTSSVARRSHNVCTGCLCSVCNCGKHHCPRLAKPTHYNNLQTSYQAATSAIEEWQKVLHKRPASQHSPLPATPQFSFPFHTVTTSQEHYKPPPQSRRPIYGNPDPVIPAGPFGSPIAHSHDIHDLKVPEPRSPPDLHVSQHRNPFFDGTSTMKEHYRQHSSGSRQHGTQAAPVNTQYPLDGCTTHKEMFTKKEAVREVYDDLPPLTRHQMAPFDGSITSHEHYPAHAPQIRGVAPGPPTQVTGPAFQGSTTTAEFHCPKTLPSRAAFHPTEVVSQSAPFDGTTSMQQHYPPPSRVSRTVVHGAAPPPEALPQQLPFSGTTAHRDDFTPKMLPPRTGSPMSKSQRLTQAARDLFGPSCMVDTTYNTHFSGRVPSPCPALSLMRHESLPPCVKN